MIVLCISLSLQSEVYSQEVIKKEIPREESTHYFTVNRFDRQPQPNLFLMQRFDSLTIKSQNRWNATDSLYYAFQNVYFQKFGLAMSIFSRLKVDTLTDPLSSNLLRVTYIQTNRFEELKKQVVRTIKNDSSQVYNLKDAYLDLINAYVLFKDGEILPDSLSVFPILSDKDRLQQFNRYAPIHRNAFVKIAVSIDSVLRQFSTLHASNDVVLSEAFEEMGDFQKNYMHYITNAYFYYAGSLYYNKYNKTLIHKYNGASKEITEKNFVSLSFKNLFGRIIDKRFNLNDNYIKGVQKEKPNVLNSNSFPIKENKKDFIPGMDTSILIMIIMGVILLVVILFVKTK